MGRIDEIAAWLRESDDILLAGHVYPDGDAAGSAIALKMALRAMGKRAAVFLPGGTPALYSFLPEAEDVCADPAALPFPPQAVMAVDVSEPNRMGECAAVFSAAPRTASLDHHGTNPGFGDVSCVDGCRAATGELALEVIRALGVNLTRDMADWLYTAICTDCGQFAFLNTTGDTMRAAAECMEAGADYEGILRRLFRTRTQARTKLLGLVLSGLTVESGGKIAYARLTEDMLREAGATREDNEGIVNYLVEIQGVRIAVLAEQKGEGTKFSLRSARGWDVASDVAVPLGGGGHANAAGVSLDMPMEEALQAVLEKARAAVSR